MTLEEFYAKLNITEEKYLYYLSISEKGNVLILKREVKARNINNYNIEMITAMNANMDIQLAHNPFAIITYIISYVGKDESGLTKFLKETLNANANKEMREKLKALKTTYLTHREMGESEAVYRVNSGMRLTDSNISSIFVTTGFPENRSLFYQKVKEDDEKENEIIPESDDEEGELQQDCQGGELIKIEGRTGKYRKAVTIIDRYVGRPKLLQTMCLAQFAMSYTYMSKPPKKTIFDKDGNSETLSSQKIFNSDVCLPTHVKLDPVTLGYMRLRRFPLILRTHTSRKKEGHKQHYAELMLYTGWRDEIDEFHRWEPDKCIDTYHSKAEEIDLNKKTIYPGESTLNLLDSEDFEMQRPTHVYDQLNAQGEQQDEDDLEEGAIDDPNYESFAYTGNLLIDKENQAYTKESLKFKCMTLPEEEELQFLMRQLVPEQLMIVREVLRLCKSIKKSRKVKGLKVKPLWAILHGGAGKHNFSSLSNCLVF